MRYLALLYLDEATQPAPGTPEWDERHAAYMRFNELAGPAIVGGDALQPAATASTVRSSDGGTLVTTGPFTETVEVIAGFYVFEADTLDDAIELAGMIPVAATGAVELRPTAAWTESPADARPGAPGPGGGHDRYLAVVCAAPDAADTGSAGPSTGGPIRAAGALQPVASATTVRVRDGEVLVTDGPFADDKQAVRRMYAFHPVTRDEALALAGQIATGLDGAVELRPILELG